MPLKPNILDDLSKEVTRDGIACFSPVNTI
jgi:hypothetical protein